MSVLLHAPAVIRNARRVMSLMPREHTKCMTRSFLVFVNAFGPSMCLEHHPHLLACRNQCSKMPWVTNLCAISQQIRFTWDRDNFWLERPEQSPREPINNDSFISPQVQDFRGIVFDKLNSTTPHIAVIDAGESAKLSR